MCETTVGLRELRNHMSVYLRRVKEGEIILITDRGKPVGQIIPILFDPETPLWKKAEIGLIEWNGKEVPRYLPTAVNRSEGLLSDIVIEGRG